MRLRLKKQAKKLADEHHIEYEERHKKGDIINLFFEEYCEKDTDPANIYYGSSDRDLSTDKEETCRSEKVERFEFFMNAWEMANAYSELNDPIDQRERFKAQEELLHRVTRKPTQQMKTS